MTPEECCNIIDLAVEAWHEVAEEHGIGHCNCFRAKFGEALIKKFNLTEEEMVEAWKRRQGR